MTTIEISLKIDGEEVPLGPQLKESIIAWSTIARSMKRDAVRRKRVRQKKLSFGETHGSSPP